jgi:SAM-dependent methyltransferase
MAIETYVHGYHRRESARLQDQAGALVDLLHSDTSYPAGSLVLEAGCGTGAQTIALAGNSPEARIVSVDISAASLAEARAKADFAGLANVEFHQADLFALPFPPQHFDHIFVCFVLEHLSSPLDALTTLKALLKPGGTITVIEGDHGSAYFHPDSHAARQAIGCLVELQRATRGNALIGRELFPLLSDGFTRKTFTAMIEGVREAALDAGLVGPAVFDAGIKALHRTAESDGVFCYTFFKGVGEK